jgi:malonyl CoA-acyl carrier protein transacylase
MGKTWSELTSRFETMGRDLVEATPDAKRLATHAKEPEKTLKKWQKQHRELGSEMGIET